MLRLPTLASSVAVVAAAFATVTAAPASAAVERGQAAPYYAAIDAWSSGGALRKAAPGIEKVGRAKAPKSGPTTEDLLPLTFEPARSVTLKNDGVIASKLPAGYPTNGLSGQLDKLRKAWTDQFAKAPDALDDRDLADVTSVAMVIGFSVYTGDQKVLTNQGALVARAAIQRSLFTNAKIRTLPDARKQTAAEIMRMRTLLALNTYNEERGQKDWDGVAQVRRGLRTWMRTGLGLDPARVKLTKKGFVRK